LATRKHISSTGKTRYEVYDDTPPTGVTGIPLPDMTAHHTAVVYAIVTGKPEGGTLSLGVFEDANVDGTEPFQVGGLVVPQGETKGRARIVLDPATGTTYHVEVSNPAHGTRLKIVMVAD
jgi:hypothetical protein